MKRLKSLIRKVFFLSVPKTILIAFPSFALVIYVLSTKTEGVLSYLSYAASAYALTITITSINVAVRKIHQKLSNHPLTIRLCNHPVRQRFVSDAAFRTEISLYQGLFINLLYVVLKIASGIYYRSMWFIVLAVYYMFLAVMRFSLLRHVIKNPIGQHYAMELRRYRLCGGVLLLMNQALALVVALVVYQNNGFEYPGSFIYVMALYAFYAIITAVINVIKFKKHGSPVLSAAKVINLTAALVSMLALETAMLTQFGGETEYTLRQIMTAATGAGVCIIVFGMAVFMIVRSTRQLKTLQSNNSPKSTDCEIFHSPDDLPCKAKEQD